MLHSCTNHQLKTSRESFRTDFNDIGPKCLRDPVIGHFSLKDRSVQDNDNNNLVTPLETTRRVVRPDDSLTTSILFDSRSRTSMFNIFDKRLAVGGFPPEDDD